MQKIILDIIGTHLEIDIDTDQSIDAVSQTIQSRFDDFQIKYSRFIEGNWLHTINQKRKGTLDIDGVIMLSKMLEIAKNTDGYFAPTVWKRLRDLWYANHSMDLKIILENQKYGNYKDIEINNRHIVLHNWVELEFGGIGKWYLIDLLHSYLYEFPRFLINFGWDLYGRWWWKIWLESPFVNDEVIGTIILDDHFLACSSGTKRRWWDHHHLIDPFTWRSSQEVVASYVEWSTGMMTDGYATALCVMPWKLACDTLERTPNITGVIVSQDGNIYQKKGSRSKVFE